MSKKKGIFLLLVTATVGLCIGVFLGMTAPKGTNSQAMKRLKVNGLPEHDLSIVDESDPSFDSRLSAYVKSPPRDSIDALKRFSVFVVNNGSRPVAGLVVNWEFMQSDGQTISK